jgi:hypothetical protein
VEAVSDPVGLKVDGTRSPATADLALLSYADSIGKPHLERLAISRVGRDFYHTFGKLERPQLTS